MLDEPALEQTAVVANNTMNRERELRGTNGYDRELGFDVVQALRGTPVRWLDVCCGTGRALIEAEALLPDDATLVGIDLVDRWWPRPPGSRVRLVTGALREFQPEGRFDLITSVHGLHYVGDKLGALVRLRSWLSTDGRLAAHLDLGQVLVDGRPARPALLHALGFRWNGRRHLVSAMGPGHDAAPPRFVGAAPAGPNFTGQPAVASHYRS
jgi:SAM-dependent methyltransferase